MQHLPTSSAELERRAALMALLELPDPPELRRGHRLTCEGHPSRHAEIVRLMHTYTQWRYVALHGEENLRGASVGVC